jgi:two-component system CheB/CheR fusion protein
LLDGFVILVLDDTDDSLRMMHILLSGEGATVTTAVNGEGGLRRARDAEFDLIISDISMPVMDGYEFLQNLRASLPRYANVPAIALTGFGRKEDVGQAHRAGFTTHLTNPLDFDHLLRLARIALRK